MKLEIGSYCQHPYCGHIYDDPVEDFAIAGRIGEASYAEEQCEVCDKWFGVTQINESTFTVEK